MTLTWNGIHLGGFPCPWKMLSNLWLGRLGLMDADLELGGGGGGGQLGWKKVWQGPLICSGLSQGIC